jgi:HEAT repeat protein
MLLVLIALLAGGCAAQTDSLLEKIATYQYGQSREPLEQFGAQVRAANPAQLKSIEAQLLRLLDSKATAAGKNFAFRQLSLFGSEASVPVLARGLTKPEQAEMAFYALSRIPGAASTDALRQSVARTSGNLRIGIVNTLGQRRDVKSIAALRPLLASTDGAGEAAALALGEIGTPAAFDALKPGRIKFPDAYLHGAVRLAESGQQGGAIRAYRELLESDVADRVRIAALGGLAAADGRNSIAALSGGLDSKSLLVQSAAIRFLSAIPGQDVTALLVERFPKLSAAGQAALLTALAERGDTAARPLFVEAANSGSTEIRLAGLTGLGRLGDGSVISLLASKAASSEKAEQAAARSALYMLNAPGVDRAVVERIGASNGKEKVELIAAAGERSISSSADVLIQTVRDSDPEVHREALRALRNVAGAGHVPALVKLLEDAPSAPDRRETAQTLAAVLKRSDAASAAPVIESYKATSAMPARLALMEVMGQTSTEAALPLLRAALGDASTEVARAAILALSEWSTPAPMADLLASAKARTSPALTVLALRGYLKLMALPSERTSVESARLLGDAMQLAGQPAEKRAVLAMLPSFPSKESLALAQAAMKDESIAKEAKIAADRISGLLKFQ